MSTHYRSAGLIALVVLSLLPARAQLSVQSTVSPLGGMFHYEYQVWNQTDSDFSIITLGGLLAQSAAVQNLSSPNGFLASFDPGLGLLSFIEDSQPFGAQTTVGPFQFDSPYASGVGNFEAVDISGSVVTGRVAAVPMSPVPEPSTYATFAALLLLVACFRRPLFFILHRHFLSVVPCN